MASKKPINTIGEFSAAVRTELAKKFGDESAAFVVDNPQCAQLIGIAFSARYASPNPAKRTADALIESMASAHINALRSMAESEAIGNVTAADVRRDQQTSNVPSDAQISEAVASR